MIAIEKIIKAAQSLKGVAIQTPLQYNEILSKRYNCKIYLKREDLQVVRSFKLRGAYAMMEALPKDKLKKGVVCASAGNHAQGVAYSCNALKTKGKLFMPVTTPKQKINQVKRFGNGFVEIILTGDTYDAASAAAQAYAKEHKMTFIHPFNDELVIAGQGTVGLEIMNHNLEDIDYVFATIGGGGLVSGVGSYIKDISPETKIIGVEPAGAASMKASFEAGHIVTLPELDKFVDGAAVATVGENTFAICQKVLDDIVVVPEGKVCTTILELYNQNAIVAEPAGALPVSALDFYKEQIKGKNIVCILSGGNNDIERMPETKERSLLYEGLMHYFIIDFPQRPGALREFVVEVLGPNDDITRFEYTKTNNREKGPTLIGIELSNKEDYEPLIERLNSKGFNYTVINKNKQLFSLFV
ncbi:MAG: threonine ammonia-lyase IlvA [Clostridia bacterium]|jgi:threonine dehydratase|nr:threonine ammonia-lyase IlvA [Clostridia bacterium]MDD4570962.1 threonine ammonia-lyase IlvA [Clostridia bacterium]